MIDCFVFLLIGHCAFGIKTDLQNDIDNVYMKRSLTLFSRDPEQMFIIRLSHLMPFLDPLIIQLFNITLKTVNFLSTKLPFLLKTTQESPHFWIFKQLEDIVKEKLRTSDKRVDLLQLMLDALTEEIINV
mgnify:CR=1 FL=1